MPALLGLRGIAAVLIVLFHINRQIKVEAPDWLWFVSTHFGHGVFLFFVLSAFSLTYTNVGRRDCPLWLKEYAIKRFFRIAPLFYAVLISELLRQYFTVGRILAPDWQILTNITFTFGLVPHASMVWAGWTIGVEMLFYAVFPALLLLMTSSRRALQILAGALFVSLMSRYVVGGIDVTTDRSPPWAYFSFQSNVWFFALGMVTFYFVDRVHKRDLPSLRFVGPMVIATLVALVWVSEELRMIPDWRVVRPDLLVFGVVFALLTAWQYLEPSWLLGNRLMRYLGDRSFSIYLCHPVFLFYFRDEIHAVNDVWLQVFGSMAFLLTSLSVLACLMVIVEITFRLVEVGGLKLSALACAWIRRRAHSGESV